MSDTGALFLAASRRSLATYFGKIEHAMTLVTDEDVWWRPNEASNSLGNLLLHLTGSTRFWIGSVVGGAPNLRVRDLEFSTRGGVSREKLLEDLRAVIAEVDAVLGRTGAEELPVTRQGFNKPTTVHDAVYHGVVHFAMHAGQVLQLVKVRAGVDLNLPL